jgi:hypothetical protein
LAKLRLGKYSFDLPRNRILRNGIGVLLIGGGILGFLPVLGFWMVPLGMIVLAEDFPVVRRLNRRIGVSARRWWSGKVRRPRPDAASAP